MGKKPYPSRRFFWVEPKKLASYPGQCWVPRAKYSYPYPRLPPKINVCGYFGGIFMLFVILRELRIMHRKRALCYDKWFRWRPYYCDYGSRYYLRVCRFLWLKLSSSSTSLSVIKYFATVQRVNLSFFNLSATFDAKLNFL